MTRALPALALALLLVGPAVAAPRARVQTTSAGPERLGLPFERLSFTAADGAPLSGWWFPARDSSAVVVLCPRRDGGMAELLPIVREFSQRGFATLTFDHRDLAPGGARDADSLRYVVFASRWVADAVAAAAEARRLAPGRHVFLWGQGLGSVVAAAAGARARHVADGVITEGLFRSSYDQLARNGTIQIPGVRERHQALVAPSDEPISAVPQLTMPLLAFIAERDSVVPPRDTRDVVRRSRSTIRQEVLPDAGHSGAEQVPGYFDRVVAFVRYIESLGPPRQP